MTDFAAIDFETANEWRTSVCSVGVVIVRGGKIVDKIYRLINPEPGYYRYWNRMIHGLGPKDTENAPPFCEVWDEIAPRIEGLPLVAHNASFDQGCLKAVFRTYRMDYPDYTFFDTLGAARRHFGRSIPDHKLDTVAEACGFCLENHHHALADAEACAHIALKIL